MAVGTGDYTQEIREYDVVLDVLHFEVIPSAETAGTVPRWELGWGPVRFTTPIVERIQ
jgi:hypothetical protein